MELHNGPPGRIELISPGLRVGGMTRSSLRPLPSGVITSGCLVLQTSTSSKQHFIMTALTAGQSQLMIITRVGMTSLTHWVGHVCTRQATSADLWTLHARHHIKTESYAGLTSAGQRLATCQIPKPPPWRGPDMSGPRASAVARA